MGFRVGEAEGMVGLVVVAVAGTADIGVEVGRVGGKVGRFVGTVGAGVGVMVGASVAPVTNIAVRFAKFILPSPESI